MQIRGLRHIVLAVVLCLGVVGCSNKNKSAGADGAYGASSRGVGQGSQFDGDDQATDFMAQRKIYFDYDRAELHDHDYSIVQAHADYLRDHPDSHVRIEGHTDEQGSREYNIALGERRAETVARALVSQGVSRHQVSVVSYGKEKPDVDGHGEESYRLNRRAVFVYEN